MRGLQTGGLVHSIGIKNRALANPLADWFTPEVIPEQKEVKPPKPYDYDKLGGVTLKGNISPLLTHYTDKLSAMKMDMIRKVKRGASPEEIAVDKDKYESAGAKFQSNLDANKTNLAAFREKIAEGGDLADSLAMGGRNQEDVVVIDSKGQIAVMNYKEADKAGLGMLTYRDLIDEMTTGIKGIDEASTDQLLEIAKPKRSKSEMYDKLGKLRSDAGATTINYTGKGTRATSMVIKLPNGESRTINLEMKSNGKDGYNYSFGTNTGLMSMQEMNSFMYSVMDNIDYLSLGRYMNSDALNSVRQLRGYGALELFETGNEKDLKAKLEETGMGEGQIEKYLIAQKDYKESKTKDIYASMKKMVMNDFVGNYLDFSTDYSLGIMKKTDKGTDNRSGGYDKIKSASVAAVKDKVTVETVYSTNSANQQIIDVNKYTVADDKKSTKRFNNTIANKARAEGELVNVVTKGKVIPGDLYVINGNELNVTNKSFGDAYYQVISDALDNTYLTFEYKDENFEYYQENLTTEQKKEAEGFIKTYLDDIANYELLGIEGTMVDKDGEIKEGYKSKIAELNIPPAMLEGAKDHIKEILITKPNINELGKMPNSQALKEVQIELATKFRPFIRAGSSYYKQLTNIKEGKGTAEDYLFLSKFATGNANITPVSVKNYEKKIKEVNAYVTSKFKKAYKAVNSTGANKLLVKGYDMGAISNAKVPVGKVIPKSFFNKLNIKINNTGGSTAADNHMQLMLGDTLANFMRTWGGFAESVLEKYPDEANFEDKQYHILLSEIKKQYDLYNAASNETIEKNAKIALRKAISKLAFPSLVSMKGKATSDILTFADESIKKDTNVNISPTY